MSFGLLRGVAREAMMREGCYMFAPAGTAPELIDPGVLRLTITAQDRPWDWGAHSMMLGIRWLVRQGEESRGEP